MYFQMAKYAQQYGALQVALEHRFYGKSRPFADLATENLAYLSSQQALADAAYFIQSFKSSIGADDSTPVVTFGCSYPGSLAAWFRLKYPHVTIASVASSAPVQAELDFYQYLDVVDRSLSFFTGPQCDNVIQSATQQIQLLLKTEAGQNQLAQLFNWCSPISDPRDVPTFMSSACNVFYVCEGCLFYLFSRPNGSLARVGSVQRRKSPGP
jgi:pimeloyl-ACP methyl ester carboxylesterase